MMNLIDEKLRTLQPILGNNKTSKLRMMYCYEDDYRRKKEIENHIDLLIARHVNKDIEEKIILPPPPENLCKGNIHIGDIEYLDKKCYPFNLDLKDVNRHIGIFGSTGSGKTTFAINLLRKFHKAGIPFLVFDWEKSYRSLTREFPDLQVITVGSDINPFYLNFLSVPPGIKFDEYIKSIIAIISEDYIGGIGADTMLLKYMEMAYQETGHPYFEDLKEIVLREINLDKGKRGKLAGRSGLWKESVSRQITFMSKGAAGTVVNPRRHFPLEKLFSKPIVLEFGNLKSPYDRKFFIHVILNWLSIYNQHQGIFSEQLKQVLVFEEFHNIAMKGKEDNMVSTLFRESRKYGIGLIAIDQTPSEIPNAIFANMNVKASFALGTTRDISAMAKAMNLDSYKAKFLGMLKTGQAIINVKQRYHDSFLIKAPFVEQPENIWDEELKAAMKKFADQIETNPPGLENLGIPQTPQDPDNFSPLDPLEKVILTSIIQRPLDGVDKRTKILGFHPSQMAQIQERAVVFFKKGNFNRFWSAMEYWLMDGQVAEIQELLVAIIEYHHKKNRYPKGFGKRLNRLIHSIPPAILRKKVRFPLLPFETVKKISQLASDDHADNVLLLMKAISGENKGQIEGIKTRARKNHYNKKDQENLLFTYVLTEIGTDTLARMIDQPIDSARASFC